MNVDELINSNNFFLYEDYELKFIKENITKKELNDFITGLDIVLEDYRALNRSVIYNKGDLTEVDKNDYVSLAPYWWPNPDTKNGLPYIRRDGETFSESYGYDKYNFRKLGFDMYNLCLLYYLTDDEKYYNILKNNLYYYLLEETTKMNPNLEHAQMIRGVSSGRCIGIIDYSNSVSPGFYMFNLLYKMGYIEESFKVNMNDWVKEFLDWMLHSKFGIEESNEHNNHSIYHDFGCVVLADFIGDEDTIKKLYSKLVHQRIEVQIKCDGSMPHELKRTRSKYYSVMSLKGILNFSIISKKYGFDIFKDSNTKDTIIKAIDFINDRLITSKINWDYPQIIPVCPTMYIPLINEAVKNIGEGYNNFTFLDKSSVVYNGAYILGDILLRQ